MSTTASYSDHPEPTENFADVRAKHPVRDGFHVHNEGSANWVVRRIVEARRYAEHVKMWAEKERLRAERQGGFSCGGTAASWRRG